MKNLSLKAKCCLFSLLALLPVAMFGQEIGMVNGEITRDMLDSPNYKPPANLDGRSAPPVGLLLAPPQHKTYEGPTRERYIAALNDAHARTTVSRKRGRSRWMKADSGEAKGRRGG